MRESCSCGSFIATLRRRELRDWRRGHVCPDRPAPPEPQKQGSSSHLEQSDEPEYIPGGRPSPIVFATAGFKRAE